MKILRVLGFLSVMGLGSAYAADETYYLKDDSRVLADPELFVAAGSANLTYRSAGELIRVALPGVDRDDPDFYCLIHVLLWGESTNEIKESKWYVYRGQGDALTPSGRWTPDRFRGSRLYGSHDVALLYLHLNVPTRSNTDARKDLIARYTTANPSKHTVAATLKSEAEEVADALLSGDAEARQPIVAKGVVLPATLQSAREQDVAERHGYLVEQGYLGVSYQMDVVKKLPSPVQNLSDALGLFQSTKAKGLTIDTEPRALYGASVFEIGAVPSDLKITGKLTTPGPLGTTKELGARTYDNEGLYYWDVSIGIPVTTVKQLDFGTADGKVFAKEIDKQNLFMLFNIFWRPVDTKNLQYRLLPSPLLGIGISSKPLDRIFAGASIGLNRAQVFAGFLRNRVEAPQTLAPGADASAAALQGDLKAGYEWKFLMGINVPVRQVVDFLKSKK